MIHSDFSIDDWVDSFDLYVFSRENEVFSNHIEQDEDAFETIICLDHTDCRHDGPCGCWRNKDKSPSHYHEEIV